MEKLTIIIPFRNEKEEVQNTLESFLKFAESQIEVILVNDASTNDYDYEDVARNFHAKYIVHHQSWGVAGSREDGIAHCITKYFLILDAHMRAYQQGWDLIILEELEKDPRSIFCCKTACLNRAGQQVSEKIGCGCFFDFSNLMYTWNQIEDVSTIKIPCIMGASYASNKVYWNFLHGLKGLRGYGFDEQFISIKTYLAGGSCKLIGRLTFGHIFREIIQVPYEMNNVDFIFNQLYLVELFYPFLNKIYFFRRLKNKDKEGCLFTQAVELIKNIDVNNDKKYYKNIFIKTFRDLEDFNTRFKLNMKECI